MLTQIFRSLTPWSTRSPRWQLPVAGLFLTVGLGISGIGASVSRAEVPLSAKMVKSQVLTEAAKQLPKDGVYLYGQAAEPDQLGQAYFVFEMRQGKVIGAFYMPRSSFDCAYGTLEADKLAMTVVDSYDKTTNPYAIALTHNDPVASTANPVLTAPGLEGFTQLAKLSDNDQRMLNTCKADYQKQGLN